MDAAKRGCRVIQAAQSQIDPFGCRGSTIRLRSGRYFNLLDPQPDQFTFSDIAGALAKICRYGGQVPRFYSVAEHCVHCYDIGVSRRLTDYTLACILLHDAAEAFIGDVTKPLKNLLGDYRAIEDRVEKVIRDKFRLPDVKSEAWTQVKIIDREMLIAEKRAMFGDKPNEKWTGEDEVRRIDFNIRYYSPKEAEDAFAFCAVEVGLTQRGGTS